MKSINLKFILYAVLLGFAVSLLFAVFVAIAIIKLEKASYPDCAPATINIYTNGREFCFGMVSVRGSFMSNSRFETKADAIEIAWRFYESQRFSTKPKPDTTAWVQVSRCGEAVK